MKIHLNTVLCFCLTVTLAIGTSRVAADPAGERPPAAGIFFQLQTLEALQGDFRQQKSLRELPFPLTSTGSFRFSREQGLYWHTKQPIDSELYISHSGILQRQDGRELMRVDNKEQPAIELISAIFFALLAGDWTTLQQHFVIEQAPLQSGWQAQLTPRNTMLASFASSIKLTGDAYIDELTFEEASGDSTHIWFENLSRSN